MMESVEEKTEQQHDPKYQPLLWKMVVLLWFGHVWLPMEPEFIDDFAHDSRNMMNAEIYRSIHCAQIQSNSDFENFNSFT